MTKWQRSVIFSKYESDYCIFRLFNDGKIKSAGNNKITLALQPEGSSVQSLKTEGTSCPTKWLSVQQNLSTKFDIWEFYARLHHLIHYLSTELENCLTFHSVLVQRVPSGFRGINCCKLDLCISLSANNCFLWHKYQLCFIHPYVQHIWFRHRHRYCYFSWVTCTLGVKGCVKSWNQLCEKG